VRIVGPNFIVRLRVQDDMVVEAARPISYMRGWKLERVRALCSDANRACAAMDKASI